MSDERQDGEEGWKPMDVGSLRKFVREDIPVRAPAGKPGAEAYSDMYTRRRTPEEVFRPFIDMGDEPVTEEGATAEHRTGGMEEAGDAVPERAAARGAAPDFSTEREAARKEGFEAGLAEGRASGHGEGYAAGHAEGLAAGREEGLAQGAAEGYDRGYEEGRIAGMGELAAQAEELARAAAALAGQWPLILGRYEREIVSLALEVAETLVYGTLAVDGSVVERAVLSALKGLPDPLKVTVAVNPEDFQQVEMARERFFGEIPELRHLELASDPGIGRGGCRVSAASGSIREDLKARMRVLRETLLLAADSGGG